ncbi:ethanolamine ammonia-lyase subunit EutC [Pedobacter sp. L105]|uniref:ethanolamine ammonia-lyase subunit EutC n=1 Tax=Pedobacter sp. L105 TaxID=1641871 RepID=UPI00131BA81B|nr:ethanolamine ammonia-lyase subunit EutC [Pedobacter sp. L105]
MEKREPAAVKINDPWNSLKQFTDARIALGRAGSSIPLKQELEFKLAHAHARDAVYSLLNNEHLIKAISPLDLPLLQLHSQAGNRQQYLQRPDLGRLLDNTSSQLVKDYANANDICIILADGLSAGAINDHAAELLENLIPLLKGVNYKLSPICLAGQARVAIGDEIAYGLQAKFSVVLIGERPGLSAADSIGAYLTYYPKPGLTDESRNCVSNIRKQGLSFHLAAEKIFYLIQEAFKRKLSGVELKDNAGLLDS